MTDMTQVACPSFGALQLVDGSFGMLDQAESDACR